MFDNPKRPVLILAALLSLGACGDDAPPPLPDYVLDSGVTGSPDDGSMAWMDNTRVITFAELNGSRTIAIWDTEANTVEAYTPPDGLDPRGQLCYDPFTGNVSYEAYDRHGQNVEVFGPLGRERAVRPWGIPDEMTTNVHSCEDVVRQGEFRDRVVKYLHPEHGALLFGPRGNRPGDDGRTKGVLVAPNGLRITTPIMEKGIGSKCSRYYAHRQAYYLTWCGWDWQHFEGKNCYTAYWLWPDGRTEEVCLPEFKNTFVLPSKVGVVMDHRVIPRSGNLDTGLNLYTHGMLWRLVDGFIHDTAALSPDGCKVAFVSAPKYTDYEKWKNTTLKLADVCAADRTQLKPQR